MQDDVTVSLFTDDTLAQGADIALKHRLYVSGWSLSHILKAIREPSSSYSYSHGTSAIAIVAVGGTPVAVAVYRRGDINTFCRKSMRRRGYGSLAVAKIKETVKDKIRYFPGIEGANIFYHNLGIGL